MAAPQSCDVLIIGAGPAGLAAAGALARQLHTAVVFDSGNYRNARATHMHNVPGWDHRDPAEYRAKSREDTLSRYDTVKFEDAAVEEVQKLQDDGGFQVVDSKGRTFRGRKLILASGVRDVMLDIEGYSDCWGHAIFPCLFCHGYEERGGASAGVLAEGMAANPAMTMHFVRMALQLANTVTIYTNGDDTVNAAIAGLQRSEDRVRLETQSITKLALASPGGSSDVVVSLADGTCRKERFIAHTPRCEVNGPFVEQLGLELGPSGEVKSTPPFHVTSVPGVYAVGDMATPYRVVSNAVNMGGFAAVALSDQLQTETKRETIPL